MQATKCLGGSTRSLIVPNALTGSFGPPTAAMLSGTGRTTCKINGWISPDKLRPCVSLARCHISERDRTSQMFRLIAVEIATQFRPGSVDPNHVLGMSMFVHGICRYPGVSILTSAASLSWRPVLAAVRGPIRPLPGFDASALLVSSLQPYSQSAPYTLLLTSADILIIEVTGLADALRANSRRF